MAQTRRLTRGHEVSSDKENWVPLEEFLVQDESRKPAAVTKSGPTYRATYRMEKIEERFASPSNNAGRRTELPGASHVSAKVWIAGAVVFVVAIAGLLIFLTSGGNTNNTNNSDSRQPQYVASSPPPAINTGSGYSAPAAQQTYIPATSSGSSADVSNTETAQAPSANTIPYSGAAVAAGSVIVINGKTRTILNPRQQAAQAGALASRTVFTKPFITTGSQDRAFGHDGYIIVGTSPSGTHSGVWVSANPLNHRYIPAGQTSSESMYIGPSPLKYSLKTLVHMPNYLTVSVHGYINGLTAGYNYPSVYARDGSINHVRESGIGSRGGAIPFGTPTTMATLSLIRKPPENLYVGVMAGQYFDSLSAITLVNTRSGQSATTVPQIYYPKTLPGGLWYFFDVAGAKAGDVLKLIETQYNTSASDDEHPGLVALTFDSVNPLNPDAPPLYTPASKALRKPAIITRLPQASASPSRNKAFSRYTGSVVATGIHAPVWLKLVRRGNVVSAYYSRNNQQWTELGTSKSINFGSSGILAGMAVCAHNNALLNTSIFSHVRVGHAQSRWTDTNIGYPGKAGSASLSNGRWTITGGGSDVWGSHDQFNLQSRKINGDTTLIGRVKSIENTDGWAKAGLMLRSSSSGTAAFAYIFVTPDIGVAFQWRPQDSHWK
jgi:hypothetical protein